MIWLALARIGIRLELAGSWLSTVAASKAAIDRDRYFDAYDRGYQAGIAMERYSRRKAPN